MQTTRRQIISGAAAATVLASAPHAAASTMALTGPDARLEGLYLAWREAEQAFGKICNLEDEADFASLFQGIEVEGLDGTMNSCKSEFDLKSIFPRPFPLTDFSNADLGAFTVAASKEPSKEKDEIIAEIWSRYPDVHAEARGAALARLKEAERAHRQSPEVRAHERTKAEWSAANDHVSAVLGTIAATPAVSLKGVLLKLRIWDDDGMDPGTPAEAVWDSAVADLRRLAGEAQS